MNSSNSSTDVTNSSPSGRKPLNPLILTSSSENIRISGTVSDSQETFCSKFERSIKSKENGKASTDLFSNAPSSNLNDLINILSKTDLNGKNEVQKQSLDKSELVSTEYQRPSEAFSSSSFARNIEWDDGEVVCLSSGNEEESDSEVSEVIEISSSSDEDQKVEERKILMTSSLETRSSSSRSTLGRKSRMERFLKDVSQNLKSLRLEDDFHVKNMSLNDKDLGDTQSMANFTLSDVPESNTNPNIPSLPIDGNKISVAKDLGDTQSMADFSISDVPFEKPVSKAARNDKIPEMIGQRLSDTQSMTSFSISNNNNVQGKIAVKDTESMSQFSGELADTESIPEINTKKASKDCLGLEETESMADFNISGFSKNNSSLESCGNGVMYKDTESMSSSSAFVDKKKDDSQSNGSFNELSIKKTDLNGTDSISERSGKSLSDIMSMSNLSFVSTRPRKKYPKNNQLPETESMTNFSFYSNAGSISPRSLRNNKDNTIANFTLSDKLSPGLRDQALYKSQIVPIACEESFSINDSNSRQNFSISSSSKRSNSIIPEESLIISETSSDPDSNPSVHSTPEKVLSANKSVEKEGEQISITAKFNIKIQLSGIIAESIKEAENCNEYGGSSPESHKDSKKGDENISLESVNENVEEDNPKTPLNQNRDPQADDLPNIDGEKSQGTPHLTTSEHEKSFDDMEFENNVKLLTKLYGDQWKTPGVKEILISQSTKKKKAKPRDDIPNTPTAPPNHNHSIDDFSNFFKNVSDDLDSTRLTPNGVHKINAPKQISKPNFKKPLFLKTPKAKELYPKLKDLVDSDSSLERESPEKLKEDSDSSFKTESPKKTRRGRTIKKRIATLKISSGSESEDKYDSDDSFLVKTSESDVSEDEDIPSYEKKNKKKDKIVYLDLTKQEVEEVSVESCASPEANRSEAFTDRLNDLLNSCKFTDKKKIEPTPVKKSKRKLFSKQYSFNEEEEELEAPKPTTSVRDTQKEDQVVQFRVPPPQILNKQFHNVKSNVISSNLEPRSLESLMHVFPNKHTFLKSLDPHVSKTVAHPDASYYRDSFKSAKEELCSKLFGIYNKKVFNDELKVPITWNKKLLTTAGRCLTTKKAGVRSARIEMSDKVCTSADRLRCTLIHELCHASTWIFSEEGGHGATWKSWAKKANKAFPELPLISVCHDYDIEYKYTYKCTLCGAKSHAHSKSKKVENIRCSFCLGAIEIFLNKKDKQGNVVPTPVKSPKGFSKFVKSEYKKYKTNNLKHADVMKLLSGAYAALDINEKKNY